MQGMLARGRARAAQAAPSTSLSWPWSSCTHATERVTVPRPQLAEHGPRDVTFHLREEQTPERGWVTPDRRPGQMQKGSLEPLLPGHRAHWHRTVSKEIKRHFSVDDEWV